MKKIVLSIWIGSQFVELSRVARLFTDSGRYHPVLWFMDSYPTIEKDIDLCRFEKWDFIVLDSFSSSEVNSTSKQTTNITFKTIIKPLLSVLYLAVKPLSHLVSFISHYYQVKQIIKKYARYGDELIQNVHPDLLIIPIDDVGYFTHVIARTFLSNGLRTVIVPFTIANATEAAESFYNESAYLVDTSTLNKWIARKYPHWMFSHRGRNILRLAPGSIFALEKSDFCYTRPWILNSDASAIIAVENVHMLEYYRNEGLPDERLVVTGALYDDILADAAHDAKRKRRELLDEFSLPYDHPLLLCVLPPSQFPRQCEFEDYSALLDYWMQVLASVENWNVIVRPHPRTTFEEIETIQSYGLSVTTHDTASLVPLCDLYLASVSATIRWVIACGIPVINYDIYDSTAKR